MTKSGGNHALYSLLERTNRLRIREDVDPDRLSEHQAILRAELPDEQRRLFRRMREALTSERWSLLEKAVLSTPKGAPRLYYNLDSRPPFHEGDVFSLSGFAATDRLAASPTILHIMRGSAAIQTAPYTGEAHKWVSAGDYRVRGVQIGVVESAVCTVVSVVQIHREPTGAEFALNKAYVPRPFEEAYRDTQAVAEHLIVSLADEITERLADVERRYVQDVVAGEITESVRTEYQSLLTNLQERWAMDPKWCDRRLLIPEQEAYTEDYTQVRGEILEALRERYKQIKPNKHRRVAFLKDANGQYLGYEELEVVK